MQWASSTTNSDGRAARTASRVSSAANCSGARNTNSNRSVRMRWKVSRRWPALSVELTTAAAPTSTPSRDSSWSCCRAINGDTTTVGPSIIRAATW